MVAYAAVDFETSPGSTTAVLAAMETYLETIDSTINPLYYIDVLPLPNGMFKGVIIHAG